jgi:hypothetical protein
MAIARKPKGSIQAEIDVDALINKGGTPAATATQPRQKEEVAVILRIPAEMLEQVDSAVTARPIKTPRHTWLLEAIYEKLNRETVNG